MAAQSTRWFIFVASTTLLLAAARSSSAPPSSAPPSSARSSSAPPSSAPPSAAPTRASSSTSPSPSSSLVAPAKVGASTPGAVKAPPPVEERSLKIVVDGQPVSVLVPASLVLHTSLSTTMAGGKARQYPLAPLLHKLLGRTARVVAVVDHDGQRAALDAAAWNGPGLVPVIWTNRRGLFKLGVVDEDGRRVDGSVEFRDVVEVHVAVAPLGDGKEH